MATKIKCQGCGAKLRVWLPPGAPSFQCPVCEHISILQPARLTSQPPSRLPSQPSRFPLQPSRFPSQPAARLPNQPARLPSQPDRLPSQPPARFPNQPARLPSQPSARLPNQPARLPSQPSELLPNQPGRLPSNPPARPSRPPALVRANSMQGRKRAVLCGLNYIGQEHSLTGCENDVNKMKYFLQYQMGFPADGILTLTEYENNQSRIPTKHNMLMALRWLVDGCSVGSSLVFYYSGHGSRKVDEDYNEVDGYDEALCPIDYKDAGMLLDDEVNRIIVNKLPRGVRLHAIIDTCYSGTVLDLPFVCTNGDGGNQYEWEDHTFNTHDYNCTEGGLVACISACPDHKSSMATTAYTGKSTGALTHCFIQAVQSDPGLTYGHLLYLVRSLIHDARAKAPADSTSDIGDPVLSSSEAFDIHSRKFVL